MKTEAKLKIIIYTIYLILFAWGFYIGLRNSIIHALILGTVLALAYPTIEIIRCWLESRIGNNPPK